ncbi:BZ3500_MvSof-1268-A1-R1_Chr2-1g04551 [Microbotryum saponariae]|uniref:BZ3500_MvSof-1268-A1-R1_Chr2-1g04551 protein n=1 Tax=Microbotryum saponariae TaxID=289078 RepID=A0A2X0L020_9BASI|nr:BZ3500_MvSof-1268-A1-R1_Chr2-1g04551 [Microbotryum saponariae]SCZ92001.1 BZ3501_MvSof-1269-A2-R1_Chr2-1g04207 [Microbotryum saponariae]
MILGIGVDLLHLPRLSSLIKRRGAERFARRILTPLELEQWRKTDKDELQPRGAELSKGDPGTTFLAVRVGAALLWAAKEATYKALYSSRRVTSWQNVQVEKLHGSRPSLKLLDGKSSSSLMCEEALANSSSYAVGETSSSSSTPRLHLSISHDGEYVVAYVVAEERSKSG